MYPSAINGKSRRARSAGRVGRNAFVTVCLTPSVLEFACSMNRPTPELDQLVLAMTHWLEAAQPLDGDLAASSRALEEARRQLVAHQHSLTRGCAGPSE